MVSFNKTGVINASTETINPNIFINSDFHSKVTDFTTWNTEKNGTMYANSWSGYNSGVANPTTCYHAHLVLFQGEYVYQYTRDTESWLGVSQPGLQNKLTGNTTYTWSIDEYRPSGTNNYIHAGLYYKKTSNGSVGFHSGNGRGDGEDAFDRWVRKVYTFTIDEIYTGYDVRFYIYGHGGTGTVYMRRPKLEIGSKATPWTLATSEGYDIYNHGFVEGGNIMKVYENVIQTNDFIEW